MSGTTTLKKPTAGTPSSTYAAAMTGMTIHAKAKGNSESVTIGGPVMANKSQQLPPHKDHTTSKNVPLSLSKGHGENKDNSDKEQYDKDLDSEDPDLNNNHMTLKNNSLKEAQLEKCVQNKQSSGSSLCTSIKTENSNNENKKDASDDTITQLNSEIETTVTQAAAGMTHTEKELIKQQNS
ncbi:hypothetical protein P691DRAFT_765779 [Macrolepiota fuliginosa MF-IS2]|uniref:Uncharacterized protein n=1 Tax=Macrolepiota fuliginosa MF-IS2 TaxID=1400762 RepID=A0A9P6BXW3_9AGAR|nr:hypothetical protein P691DRAFT_765779 [Macrolepiota fuliginosa MF-IS2]